MIRPPIPQAVTTWIAATAVTAFAAVSAAAADAAPGPAHPNAAAPSVAPTWAAATNPKAAASASASASASAAARSAAVRSYVVRAGRSPGVPNPNPPLGGLAPNGMPAGGSALRQRGFVLPTGAPALPTQLTAQAWMVTDLDTGAVLAARDPHGRYQPASVLKLLAGLVMLPHLPGTRVITATAQAANAEGSAVGLVPRGRYTVDTLFKSLYMMSGNDAAMALAVANGGPPRTVAEMNAYARQLGANDTVVQTPSGLDGWSQLTSAYDLTLVLRAAVNTPRLLAYDEARTAQLPAQKVGKRTWGGVPLFNESANFFTTVPGAILAKTGYTGAAQHTYVCAAERGGRRIGVVFLRNQRRPLDQDQQAGALLNWAFALPRTTAAVGRLDGVVGATPTLTSTPSTGAAATSAPGAGAVAEPSGTPSNDGRTGPASRHAEGWTSMPLRATFAVVAVLAFLVRLVGRRHRRARRYR